jgi:lysophospholipase L1-like esterase
MKKIGKKGRIFIIAAALLIAVAIISVCLVQFGTMRAVSDAKKYYNNKVSAFSVENFNSSTGQIVFVGDSITDLYKLDSYYADLDLASYNRGIGGDTTQGVIERLNVSIFDIMPSKIVLMIGTNDVNGNVQNEKILSNYRIIFDEIKKNQPTVDVFVMSIIPQNKDIEKAAGIDVTKNNKTIKYLNSEIKNLCGEYGYSFLEIYDLLLDEEGYLDKEYSDDGLHLNAAGFEIWTEVLKPYLMK